jgi:hypothetical protein
MAKVNRNYCKPDADMKPVFAPAAFRYNGKDYWHPEKEDFAQVGYLPLEDSVMPTPPEGKRWERSGKIYIHEGGYAWDYVLVDNPPPPPRRWSSLAIKRVLEARGSWAEVKAMLEEMNAYDDFLMADYIAEDDDVFIEARTQAVVLYGGEKVARILDAIPTE